jgi:EpsI family protein
VVLLAAANGGIYALRARLAAGEGAAPFFPELPDALGEWRASAVPVDESVYEYLAPDKLSSKVYRLGEDEVRTAAIYSRDWRSVHSPAACITGGGWAIVEQQPRIIQVPGGIGVGELPTQELVGVQEKKALAALYTFLTPGQATDDWVTQCFRMAVSGRGRGGVLLLLTADVRDSPAETQELLRGLLLELYMSFARTWEPSGRN